MTRLILEQYMRALSNVILLPRCNSKGAVSSLGSDLLFFLEYKLYSLICDSNATH